MPSSPNDYGPQNNPLVAHRPWASNEERLVDQALAAAVEPAAVLSKLAPVALPQVEAFRPRTGYGSKDDRTPTIADVLSTGHFITDRRTDFSGRYSSYSGTSTPSSPNPF